MRIIVKDLLSNSSPKIRGGLNIITLRNTLSGMILTGNRRELIMRNFLNR